MTQPTILFHYADENIHVNINIFFKQGDLVVEGIDKGPVVLHKTGKNAFKYALRVSANNLNQLYQQLELAPNSKERLIHYFTDKYAINTCISEIGSLLNKGDIPFEYHSWH